MTDHEQLSRRVGTAALHTQAKFHAQDSRRTRELNRWYRRLWRMLCRTYSSQTKPPG